jgi:hypothetical protein
MSNTEIQEPTLNTVNENEVPQQACSNCHAMITGPYCGQCGQGSESSIKYFWTVILHLLDDIFSFDSRASRTLWPLLTRPGFLTNEYILGRRVHYVPPLRLYLFISIVFFITLKFFAASDSNAISINNSEEMLTQVRDHISDLKQQHEVLINNAPTKSQESQLQAIQLVKQNLDTFNTYQNDLSNPDNKLLKAITSELVSLEFEKLKSNKPLSVESQKQYTKMTEQIVKARKGEKINFMSLVNSSDETLLFSFLSAEKNKKLNKFANELEEKASKAIQNGTGPLLQQTISKLPQLIFVLLPLFAVILKIMYMFSNRFYMEHLTVALHSHSFVFLSILQIEIITLVQDTFLKTSPMLDSTLNFFSTLILIWVPIYLFIMQKRVYKQGYLITFIKYFVIGMTYSTLISLTAIIAFVWGLIDLSN